MWFLIQSSIIFAVVASNIKWYWTPNGYLASNSAKSNRLHRLPTD
jgi:hypothetical protein